MSETQCPLMAQSGHPWLHRTCLLSGVKQTSMADKSIHGPAAYVRCASADLPGGGSPAFAICCCGKFAAQVIDRKGHANALAWQAGFADIARTQKRVFFPAIAVVF